MLAEVISIGDELTSGQRLDTNSQWLSRQLGELGIAVRFHTTVADDLQANIEAFRLAADRADVVVATGGLGPTADDLTREALSRLSGRPLVLDEATLERLRQIFAFFGRDMPENNVVQAMFPEGAQIVPNPNGTAPGIELELSRSKGGVSHIFALPGVPAEMRHMWHESVAPRLRALCGAPRVIRYRQIRCFGKGESHVERLLPDLIRRGREPRVGITVSDSIITLRIAAEGDTVEACEAAIEPTVKTIRECLGDLVFGEGDDELEDVVIRRLQHEQSTLAVVECGTGGLVSQRLQRADPAGGVFLGGVVINSSHAARQWLSLPSLTEAEFGQCDDALLQSLARACRERSGAELALAIAPLPALGRDKGDPPRARFALATAEQTIVRSAPLVGQPEVLQSRAAKQALNMIRLHLMRRASV